MQELLTGRSATAGARSELGVTCARRPRITICKARLEFGTDSTTRNVRMHPVTSVLASGTRRPRWLEPHGSRSVR